MVKPLNPPGKHVPLAARRAALRARLDAVVTHARGAEAHGVQREAAVIARLGGQQVGTLGRWVGRADDHYLTRAEGRLDAIEQALGIAAIANLPETMVNAGLEFMAGTVPPEIALPTPPVDPFAAVIPGTALRALCDQIRPWSSRSGEYLAKYVAYRLSSGVEHYVVCPEDKHHPEFRLHYDMPPDAVAILGAGLLRLTPEGETVRVALDGNSTHFPTTAHGIVGFTAVRGQTCAPDDGMYAVLDSFRSQLGSQAVVQAVSSAYAQGERVCPNDVAAPLAVLRRELATQYAGLAKYVVYDAAGTRAHALGLKSSRHVWRLPQGPAAVVGAGFVRLLFPTAYGARPILVIDGSSGSFRTNLDAVILSEDEPGELAEYEVTAAADASLHAVVAYWQDLIGHQVDVRAYRDVEHLDRITEDERLL